MLARRGLRRLLQTLNSAVEPSASTQHLGLANDVKGLHHLAATDQASCSLFNLHRDGSRRDSTAPPDFFLWHMPRQARLASSLPAEREETLEGSELPVDDLLPPAADSFSSAAPADDALAESTGTAASSLDATTVLDAVNIAEADAVASALEGVWPLTAGMQSLLLTLHGATGLPWWGTIALATVGTRLVTAPLTLMQIRNTYRMTLARPEMEKITAWMKTEGATNPGASQAAQERMAQVWSKYNCNPMKSLAGTLGQAVVFMTFFFALKSLAAAKVPSMVNGGALWFIDLTSADPYYGLPLLTGSLMLAMVQLNAAEGMQGQPPTMIRNFKIGMSVLAVAIIPFSYLLPKSVFIYWLTSNAMVAIQNTALRLPAVKRYFKIPELKHAETQASFDAAASVIKTYSNPPPHKPR